MAGRVILHDYWRSSSSYRVRIALNLLAIPHERVTVDLLKGEQTGQDHLARNPQGLVPALEIDGLLLTQSLSILEYLNETRQAGFLPREPAARQTVRALSYAIAMEIQPVCNLRVAKHAVSYGGSATTESWMQHFIHLGLEGFEGLLGERPESQFCHGDGISIADICLVPQIYNARRWGVALDEFHRTRVIAERLEALAPFADAHPEKVKPVA